MRSVTRLFKKFGINILIAAVLVFISLIGLSCKTAASNQLTTVPKSDKHVTALMDDDNSLIFHIQGSVATPGKVMVKFWSDGTGPFVTVPTSTTGTAFSVEVMRLRPLTKYNFQVLLQAATNTPVSQYQGSFTAGPLPSGLQGVNIQLVQGNPSYDLVMLDFNDTDFNGIVITDRDGKVVWYYQHDKQVFAIAQRDNNNLVFNEISQVAGYSMTEIAPDGREVRSIDDTLENGNVSQPRGRWHHEMFLRPGNKVWTLGSEIRSVNINGTDTLLTGGTIEEWDETKGTVTRLVSLFDILDSVGDRTADSSTEAGFFWEGSQNQYANQTQDWTHSNSLNILPDGKILMSNRHLNQIIAINPDFSSVAWKLGGQESDFTFPNPSDQFYHQHYAQMLPNGHVLLFDNGNLRPVEQGGQYSRAEELELNFNTMQARKVWEYRSTPDHFASAVGSVVRLNNGNTVVDFGVADIQNPGVYTVVEADPAGKAVAVTQISAPGKTIQYRVIPLDNINGETRFQP